MVPVSHAQTLRTGAPRHTQSMTKTLITGANKGLGYQVAKPLLAEGHEVWVGARNAKLGEEAARTLDTRFCSAGCHRRCIRRGCRSLGGEDRWPRCPCQQCRNL